MSELARVNYYRLHWNTAAASGEVVLVHNLPGLPSEETRLVNLEQANFATCVDILRNERPVLFDRASMSLLTENEPVGEGEMN